jgi:hypothetical protein
MRLTFQYLEQIVNNCEARRLDPVAGAEDKIKKIVQSLKATVDE